MKFKNTNPILVLVNLFLVKLFAIIYIKYLLFNLYIVKISKKSKNYDKKKKIFKFHNTNNPSDNLQQVSYKILSNFYVENMNYLNCK